jgi:hypothetical protein
MIHCVSIKKTNWLMGNNWCKRKNHAQHVYAFCRQNAKLSRTACGHQYTVSLTYAHHIYTQRKNEDRSDTGIAGSNDNLGIGVAFPVLSVSSVSKGLAMGRRFPVQESPTNIYVFQNLS